LTAVTPELRLSLDGIVQRSALYLDERRFGEYLELTAPEFRYRIEAYSPELRRNMTWLDHDRAGLAALIELLPRHHVNGADWLRQVVLSVVTLDRAESAEGISSLSIFHTDVDVGDALVEGGSTRVFAVGRYHDRFRLEKGRWLLSERTVRLRTRQLGIGSHLFP
jgi:methanesulfonate monooxygenase subunit beta